ncbi:hypothetical protein MMC13_003099, partial [Lambiella insularis]|nr:hypothetical protein [Lambiella insularis]
GDGREGPVGPGNSGNASPTARGSQPSSVVSLGNHAADPSEQLHGMPAKTVQTQTSPVATQTLSTAEVTVNYETPPAPKVETLSYSIGIQTTDAWPALEHMKSSIDLYDSDADFSPSKNRSPKPSKRLNRRELDREEELRRNIRQEIEEEMKLARDFSTTLSNGEAAPARLSARALTGDEMGVVTASPDFAEFLERSSKVVERALDQGYDVLANYAPEGLNDPDDHEDEGYTSSRGKKGRRMREIAQFYDERWSKKRMISDLNFSPK